MKARIIIILAALGVALAVTAGAQARALTLSQSGQPGAWKWSGAGVGSWDDLYCEGAYWYPPPPYTRYFQVQPQNVERSPLRPAEYQNIYMQVRLEWSADARTWYLYQARNWQSISVRPGFYAQFSAETFNLSAYSGYFWRTRVEFRWYVGSTWLGTALDSFTQSGIRRQYQVDTATLASTGEGICRLW
jgi:hypothetical protein